MTLYLAVVWLAFLPCLAAGASDELSASSASNYFGFFVGGARDSEAIHIVPLWGLTAEHRFQGDFSLDVHFVDIPYRVKYLPGPVDDYLLGTELKYYFGGDRKRFHVGAVFDIDFSSLYATTPMAGFSAGYDFPIGERWQLGLGAAVLERFDSRSLDMLTTRLKFRSD